MQKRADGSKYIIELVLVIMSSLLFTCGLIFNFTLPIGNFKISYELTTIYPLSAFMFGGFVYGYGVNDKSYLMRPLNVSPQFPIAILGVLEIVLLISSLIVVILALLDKYKDKFCLSISLSICVLSIIATILNFCAPHLLVFEPTPQDYYYTLGPGIILCGIFLSIAALLNALVFINEKRRLNKTKK